MGFSTPAGVGPGDLVGLVHGTGPDFLACLFGALRAGAAASVLPVPHRSAETAWGIERIGRIVESAGMRHIIADGAWPDFGARFVAANPAVTVLRPEAEETVGPRPEPTQDDLAVVQFTSGTTGRPRGVMLTHRAVLAGLVPAFWTRLVAVRDECPDLGGVAAGGGGPGEGGVAGRAGVGEDEPGVGVGDPVAAADGGEAPQVPVLVGVPPLVGSGAGGGGAAGDVEVLAEVLLVGVLPGGQAGGRSG